MSIVSEPPAKRSNVALIVSLCLNFILLGVIAMGAWRAHEMMMMGPPLPPGGTGMAPQMLMHLVPGEADKVRAVLEAHRDRLMALHRDAMEARRGARSVFLAPDFTRQSFAAALDRVHKADEALEVEHLKVMAETAATLTPEERKTVDAFTHDRGEQRRRHRGPGGF
jgi:Spy/CpxP family protein refolding chaperone